MQRYRLWKKLPFMGPSSPVFLALQHKIGNTYFTSVLRDLVRETDFPEECFKIFKRSGASASMFEGLEPNSIIRLANFSYDQLSMLPLNAKVFATKRDPRGLIVSCTDYHIRGSEKWTQVPERKYGGKSYCELLRDAPTDEDRLIISMENRAGEILRRMESYVGQDDVHMVALEDLSHDDSGETYRELCRAMGLSEQDSAKLYELLVRHALWNLKRAGARAPNHSTSGVDPKVIERLKGRALRHYRQQFGDIHLRLGYEN